MRISTWLIVVLFVAATVGFTDSAYLTAQHMRGVVPPCGLLLSTCDSVLTSSYASIGPIPVAALGLAYYGLVLVLLIAYLDMHDRRILHWTSWLISGGMLGTIYFVSIQAFVLHAFCPYCLVSALTTTVLFAAGVRIMRID